MGRGAQRRTQSIRFLEIDILGQNNGELVLWNGDDAAIGAMNDRNGRAPVPLAGDEPVCKKWRNSSPAFAASDELSQDLLDAFSAIHAVD